MENELVLLQDIKSALWILIYIVGIGVVVAVIKAVVISYRAIKNEIDNKFYNTAAVMYENEDYDEVIEYCQKYLNKKPKEAYGYWFLGKAYFQKKEYDKATNNFNKAVEIYPSWKEEWVSPYLKKIEAAKELSANN